MGQKVRHRVTLAGKCRNELGGAIHVMWEGRVAVQRGWSYTVVRPLCSLQEQIFRFHTKTRYVAAWFSA